MTATDPGYAETPTRDDRRIATPPDHRPVAVVCGDYASEGEPDGLIEVHKGMGECPDCHGTTIAVRVVPVRT